jgi:hypothetical protein
MFDLALHHLTDGEREREAAADLRRRQVVKTADTAATREPRPVSRLTSARIGTARPAER